MPPCAALTAHHAARQRAGEAAHAPAHLAAEHVADQAAGERAEHPLTQPAERVGAADAGGDVVLILLGVHL